MCSSLCVCLFSICYATLRSEQYHYLIPGDISTTFKLSCHDWQDDGWNKIDGTGFHVQESAVLTYSYAYFDKFGTIHTLAGNNVQLPSGDPDNDYIVPMKGYVTDQYGVTSETSFTVKVRNGDKIYLVILNTLIF